MKNNEEDWQNFLDSHEDFVQEFSEELSDKNTTPEKEYGMTLFSGEPNGYFMTFNAQIDIFQFVRLLRYFFGIDGVDVGHVDEEDHHFHNIDNELDDDENDDE
jgi:hypothetical protein